MDIKLKRGGFSTDKILVGIYYWDNGQYIPNMFFASFNCDEIFLDTNGHLRIKEDTKIEAINISITDEKKHQIEKDMGMKLEDLLSLLSTDIFNGMKFEKCETPHEWKLICDCESKLKSKIKTRNCELYIPNTNINVKFVDREWSLFDDCKEIELNENVLIPLKEKCNKNGQLEFAF
jgi:hypothetical protein